MFTQTFVLGMTPVDTNLDVRSAVFSMCAMWLFERLTYMFTESPRVSCAKAWAVNGTSLSALQNITQSLMFCLFVCSVHGTVQQDILKNHSFI